VVDETSPLHSGPLNECFYEKVIKVKADVAALLNLFSDVSHSGVVFAHSPACSLASTLRLTVLAFCIIVFSFRLQNILDLLRTKSSWKLWPTPPHRCHASIRTLNGPLQGPVQVGVRSKYPGPSLP
jgi:hypothetical protein